MKRSVLVALSLLAISLSASGQMNPAAPAPQYYLIHEELARPAMLTQYETATRGIIAALMDKKADPKVFGMNLYATTDFHYIFVVPITNFGSVDTLNQAFMTIGAAIGKDKWADLMMRDNSAMYSYNDTVAVRRDDLSYRPANPRMKTEDERFVHLAYYYVDAARMDDAEQVAKDYASLFKAKNITTPFTVFQALSGIDLPLLVVSAPGKSAADFYANDESVNATLGKDVLPLQARALAITRKYETRDAMYRPELSFPPKPAMK